MRRSPASVVLGAAAFGGLARAASAAKGIICPYTANAVFEPVFGQKLCYAYV